MNRHPSPHEGKPAPLRLPVSGSSALWFATFGPIGRCRFAPGTVATAVVGAPFALCAGLLPLVPALVLTAFVIAVSCYLADCAEKELGKHDPGEVVIDELAGYLVTMVGQPLTASTILMGFAAFRLFDIWKPWPIRLLDEKLKGGIGVVMDDVGAGIYAHLLVWALLKLWQ